MSESDRTDGMPTGKPARFTWLSKGMTVPIRGRNWAKAHRVVGWLMLVAGAFLSMGIVWLTLLAAHALHLPAFIPGAISLAVGLPVIAATTFLGIGMTQDWKIWQRIGLGMFWVLMLVEHSAIGLALIVFKVIATLVVVAIVIAVLVIWFRATRSGGGDTIVRGANSHFNGDGSDKRSYWSRGEAEIVANRQSAQEGTAMNVYECERGGHYHVGHAR